MHAAPLAVHRIERDFRRMILRMSALSAARPFLRILMLAVVVGVAAWLAASHVTVLVAAENWLLDFRAAAFSPTLPPEDRIVVLAISEETLATLPQRSPIDRGFLAGIVADLRRKGVRAIGMDLLIDRPTRLEADNALRDALHAEGDAIVVGMAGGKDGLTPQQLEFQTAFLDGLAAGSVAIGVDAVDGVARRLPDDGLAAVLAGSLGAPRLRPGQLIAWRGSPTAEPPPFRIYPAEFTATLPDEWIRGKVALIGVDLPSADRYPTPFRTTLGPSGGMLPGVMLHAHFLSQMLDGRQVFTTGGATDLALTMLFGAVGAGIAAASWRARTKVGLVLLGCALALVSSVLGFRLAGLTLPWWRRLSPS
jgi:adenylate cyclase